MSNDQLFATVISDASWCPETRAAGYACWVVCNGDRVKDSGPIPFAPVSSNDAEIYALRRGVELARRQFKADALLLQSDCVGALHRFGLYGGQKKSRYTPISRTAMKEHFLGEEFKVMCKHVKGHTSNPDARSYVNRWCDKEAGRYMLAGRGKSTEEADDWSPIDTEDKFDD